MRIITSWSLKVGLTVLVGLTLMLAVFWTPDIDFADAKAKFGQSPSQFFTNDAGDRVHYRDLGQQRNSEQTFVFIHGTSASLHTWQPLIERLSKELPKARFISLDLPGHGLSGATISRDYSRQAMVNAVLLLMDHLRLESATLVGNSLGGAVAWMTAVTQPARVNGLVLLAPSGAPRSEASASNIGFRLLQMPLAQKLITKISPRFLIDKSLQQSVADVSLVTKEMTDRYWLLLRMQGNRQAMIDLANTPRDLEPWSKIGQISAPSLIIWGTEDQLLPVSMSRYFDDELPNSELYLLDNVGHLPMEEAAKLVANKISDFCQQTAC